MTQEGAHCASLRPPSVRRKIRISPGFQEQDRKQVVAWVGSLDTHQARTDILGALDAAMQVFDLPPNEMNRGLVVLLISLKTTAPTLSYRTARS